MTVPVLPPIDHLVSRALAEDLGVEPRTLLSGAAGPALLERDVTGSSVLPADAVFVGRIVARESGVVCGIAVAERAFSMLAEASGTPDAIRFEPLAADGDTVASGTAVAEVEGMARVVLAAERTALNALMVLSGIATEARRWQEAAGASVAVMDTRKTAPGLRALSKWAVACGGARPHRSGLWDMVLIKDNHVRLAGGVAQAVAAARRAHPDLLIEAEAATAEEAREAAAAGADIVLLDNMDAATMRLAVDGVGESSHSIGRSCLTEASGGVVMDQLDEVVACGVDRVSTSALTLAPPLDFGLDELDALD